MVRLRSQQRNGRPIGVVDDLIRQIQVRQRSASSPTAQRIDIRREEAETVAGRGTTGAETGSARRRKKRGSGGHNHAQDRTAPSHLHLMYREEDEDAVSREREDDGKDASDA